MGTTIRELCDQITIQGFVEVCRIDNVTGKRETLYTSEDGFCGDLDLFDREILYMFGEGEQGITFEIE